MRSQKATDFVGPKPFILEMQTLMDFFKRLGAACSNRSQEPFAAQMFGFANPAPVF
jgi:hypothetical protein